MTKINQALEGSIQWRRDQDNSYPIDDETKMVNIATGEVMGTYADHLRRGAAVGKMARRRLLALGLNTGRGSAIDEAERPLAREVVAVEEAAHKEHEWREGLSPEMREAQFVIDAIGREIAQDAYNKCQQAIGSVVLGGMTETADS